jgi:transposase
LKNRLIDTPSFFTKKTKGVFMSTSLLYHTQGLCEYNYLSTNYIGGKVHISIEQKKGLLKCVNCKSHNVLATKFKSRNIKGVPIGRKQTIFEVKIRRLRCADCGADRQEEISCTPSPKAQYTKAMVKTVLDLRPKMSISDVASFLGLHWGTVKDIEKKYLQKKFTTIRLKDVEVIGMDELYVGNEFITIVRDLESGAVLHVGDGKSGDALKGFVRKLNSSKCKIKAIAMDLGPAYAAWAKKYLPNARIVYDHFHLIKLMNKKLDDLRRKTMNEADDEMKKQLKKKRFLFLKNEENHDEDALIELENLKESFGDLGFATFMKECLRKTYSLAPDEYMAKTAFDFWCKLADESGISCLEKMAKTIRRHMDGILGYWKEGRLTSAGMEGFNNKVRWLIRQAYGYQDHEYFKLKIFDLPNIKVAKEL